MLKQIYRQFNIEWLGNVLRQNFDSTFFYAGERHDFIEMLYLEKGELEVVEDGNVYILHTGDIIFHAPLEFHKQRSVGQSPITFRNVSCVIKGNAPKILFDGVFRLDSEERAQFLRFFEKAYKFDKVEISPGFLGHLAAEELTAFILNLCTKQTMNNHFSSLNGAVMFNKLVNTMKENLSQNISVSEVASLHNISVSYVKNLFYKYADMSPKKYYSQLRLIESIKLLENGLTPAEIAETMNFSSVSHFSVFFKENMGISPSKYRKEIHDKERTEVL